MQWGKCAKVRCKVRHPVMCRNIIEKKFCNMEGCWNRHPTKMGNEYKNENNQQRPNANNPNYNQHNFNNGQRGGPQMYNTGYNQHQMQNAQGRHMDNQNFTQNRQTQENTMNTQQTLSRILEQLEELPRMATRVNNIERQMNGWNC